MFLIKSPNLQDFRVFQNCDRKKLRNPKEHIFQTYSYRKTDCKRTEFRCAYHTRCRRQKRRIPCKKARRKSKSVFSVSDLLKNVAILILASCIGMLFRQLGLQRQISSRYMFSAFLWPRSLQGIGFTAWFLLLSAFWFSTFLYQSAVHTSGLRSRISCHLFNYVFGGTAHKLACREVKRACETVCKGGLIWYRTRPLPKRLFSQTVSFV